MGPPHRGNHRRQRQGDVPPGECRGAPQLERARHQDRRLQVFLRRRRQRHRPRKRRPRTIRAPAHPPRHPHHRGLGHRGRLLRRRGQRRNFLPGSNLAVPPPIRRLQLAGLVQRRPPPPIRHRQQRRRRRLVLGCGNRQGPPLSQPIPLPAGQRLLHPGREGQHGGHHAPRHLRGHALQIRLRHRHRSIHPALVPRETLRRRQAIRPPLLPAHLRPGRQRREIRRQDPPRRENEHPQGLASGHRGLHRGQDHRGEKSLGAHRAGLRRQLQRRRLRLGDVSKRKPHRPRQRRVHAGRRRWRRLVDAPRFRWRAVRKEKRPRAAPENRPRHLDLRRSRDAVRLHHPHLAHLQGQRPPALDQPLLRVSVPQRHRLQPVIAQPRALPTGGRHLRHRPLPIRHPPLPRRPGNPRGPRQLPDPGDRGELPRLPHARPRLCQSRRAHHEPRPRLRQRRGPRPRLRHHRAHDRLRLRGQRGNGRRRRPVPVLS